MDVLTSPDAMRTWSWAHRRAGRRVGVVPTMGALHDGHRALIRAARERSDLVVVTIFVNPLQFNQSADFDSYPRPIDDDLAACAADGVDAVYAPTGSDMYPPGFETHVEPGGLAERLEGPMRPGHFRGVVTVVTKLLAATGADVAAFGQKDFQQLAIVRRLVRDLDLGVEVIGVPIVREPDGLALSSRNVRLTPDDRRAAVVLSAALDAAEAEFRAGERRGRSLREAAIGCVRSEPLAKLEYVELADADDLSDLGLEQRVAVPAVMLAAAWFGDVRLIDNRLLAH